MMHYWQVAVLLRQSAEVKQLQFSCVCVEECGVLQLLMKLQRKRDTFTSLFNITVSESGIFKKKKHYNLTHVHMELT